MDYVGHDKAWRQFSKACDSGKTHHGWILAGARGLGKSVFALKAASALVDPTHVHANLIARGSHPDILWVKRLPKDAPKDDEDVTDETELKRSITVDQIRSVQQVLTSRPGLSDKRAIIIDSADDLERGGAGRVLGAAEVDRLQPATTLDAFLAAPLVGKLSVILRAENLTDETIVTRNQGGSIDLGVPRTLWAGLRYGF